MRIMTILNLDSIAIMAEYIDKDNNVLDKDNPKTQSNSKFSSNLSQNTLEGKGKSQINFENLLS